MDRLGASRLGAIPNASGALTRLAYAHLKSSGIEALPLLRRANLTVHQVNDASIRLRVPDQIRFLNLAAAALRDELFGFHLSLPFDLREFGFLYYISASSGTLDGALQQLARYGSIANEGVSLKYFSAANIGIAFHYVGVGRHYDRHQIEFFIAALVRLFRYLTGIHLVPSRVRLAHRSAGERSELTQFFGGKVEFDAGVDEVSFASINRDMPIVSADHHLNKLLVTYCEEALRRRSTNRSTFRSDVENAIVPLLPRGMAKLGEIARRLGVSQRTLARRLSAERLTYSGVLENLKVDLAKRYLADEGLSISQVAWLLGYREISSFTHAFKRWTGRTPRDARIRRTL
jgi:AraC-like DNA-binding protein